MIRPPCFSRGGFLILGYDFGSSFRFLWSWISHFWNRHGVALSWKKKTQHGLIFGLGLLRDTRSNGDAFVHTDILTY